MRDRLAPIDVIRRVDWWLVLVATTLALVGLVFIHSATRYDPHFAGQHLRQALFLGVSAGLGGLLILIPYPRIMRLSWVIYGAAVLSLCLVLVFGVTINGAQRWFQLPGFLIQPSEFAKIGVILALAAWFRFRPGGGLLEGLVWPACITLVPALLVMRQPDLGSSLVYWPIMLAISYVAGTSGRHLLFGCGAGLVLIVVAWFTVFHEYQQERVYVWAEHFRWSEGFEAMDGARRHEVEGMLRGPAWQPWQSLIAVGSGGLTGFGLGQGPQNRYDFLPYRNADYVFAVVAEEKGLLGALLLLALQGLLVALLLRLAVLTRERFGRLVIVGIAAFLGAQSLMHVAVCTWLVPAKGLPAPLLSYGGSSTMAAVLSLSIAVGIGARRQHVLAADGWA